MGGGEGETQGEGCDKWRPPGVRMVVVGVGGGRQDRRLHRQDSEAGRGAEVGLLGRG